MSEHDESAFPLWTHLLDRHDTPLLSMIGTLPTVGDSDKFGRTLIEIKTVGTSEEIAAVEKIYRMMNNKLVRLYHEQGFEEGDCPECCGWMPIQTDRSRALRDHVDALREELDRLRRRVEVWDRELTHEEIQSQKVTWGWAKNIYSTTIAGPADVSTEDR